MNSICPDFLQEGFVEERSIAAIRGYRFAEDAEDRDEELNLAIESFQETVRSQL